MFSATASKKVMIDNLRKSKMSGKSIHELVQNQNDTSRAPSPKPNESTNLQNSNSSPAAAAGAGADAGTTAAATPAVIISQAARSSKLAVTAPGITSETVEKDLMRKDVRGEATRKIADAVSKFSVDRDGIMLESFKTSALNFEDFRMLLKRVFLIVFSDEEYKHVCELFDADGSETIDGDEFLVGMRLLSSCWKSRNQRLHRQREKELEDLLKAEEEKRQAEKESILESLVDFNFTPKDHESVMEMFRDAAGKFIKIDPNAAPLHGFEVKYLKPAAFKVLVRNTFGINLSKYELGAAVRYFEAEDGTEKGCVHSNTFLLKFSRIGLEVRNLKRLKQIDMSRSAQNESVEKNEKLLQKVQDELEQKIDWNFADSDHASAIAKLRKAAAAYRKSHSSSVSLDGFNGTYLTPGIFREMLKRTFNIFLTGKELGAMVKYFDEDDRGEVSCKSFLVYVGRTGAEERGRQHSLGLLKQKEDLKKRKEAHDAKLLRIAKKSQIDEKRIQTFTDKDLESATAKVQIAARHYQASDTLFPGALSAFKVSSMTPDVFLEKCWRGLQISFTLPELGAMVKKFDLEGDGSLVDCAAFGRWFKKLGLSEKEKLWAIERERRTEVMEKAASHDINVREKFLKAVEAGAVSYDYSETDMKRATEKMRFGASQYDKSNPLSIGLHAFEGTWITPGQLKEKLKRTFNIDLNAKELGAIAKPLLMENENVNCGAFIQYFLALSKEHRENLRSSRIESERAAHKARLDQHKAREDAKRKVQEDLLKHQEHDTATLMTKLNSAAQAFAIDNASYLRVLHILKTPSLAAPAFQDAFSRIFLIRLTLPEIGLLMRTVNEYAASHHLVDGISFLKGFYKLSRLQEMVLMGSLDEKLIDISILRPDSQPSAAIRAIISSMKDYEEVGEEGKKSVPRNRTARLATWNYEYFDELTHQEKAHAGPPLLPSLLHGVNPWNDWGLAEAGFLSALSSSRPLTSRTGTDTGRSRSPGSPSSSSPPSPSPAPSSARLKSISRFSPRRSVSPPRGGGGGGGGGGSGSGGGGGNPSDRLVKTAPVSISSLTSGLSLNSPGRPEISISDMGDSDVNSVLPSGRRTADHPSSSGKRAMFAVTEPVVNTNASAPVAASPGGLPDISSTPYAQLSTLKIVPEKYLRPSLPPTFSPMGLARQSQRWGST